MKRIIIALLLVGTSVFISIFGYCNLKATGKKLINSFEKTATAYQSSNDTDSSLKSSLELWEKHKTSFEIYINHDELDEIQMKTKQLEQYLNGKRDVKVDELCFDCINKLEHIIDAETPSFGEVF